MSSAGVPSLADEAFEIVLDADPFTATLYGLRDRDAAVPNLTEAGEQHLRGRCLAVADRLEAVVPGSADESITQAAAVWELRSLARVLACRPAELLAEQINGPQHQVLHWSVPRVTLGNTDHAEQYLQRLAQLDVYLDTGARRLRTATAAGRTGVARNVRRAIEQIDDGLASDLADLRRPAPPDASPAFVRRRDAVIEDTVRPALVRYRSTLAEDVLPHARPDERAGLAHLDDEEETYAALVARHTSVDRDAGAIHQIGLDCVARIREEMAELGAAVLGTNDADAIIERLRTDPALRCRSADDIVDVARAAIRRGINAAPRWFNRLPSAPIELEVMPDDQARHTPPHYIPPSEDGSRPGRYMLSALDPQHHTRPDVESTAFHEGVPGHHFQLALSLELDLPRIRKFVEATAYVEGWALYAERLADEMGLYGSPVDRLGMLIGESFRACRLVVDTGLHLLGWPRDQALAFMSANTPLQRATLDSEIDRYIASPGQALGYMIGSLEITRLREQASQRPVSEFHDVVLTNGVLPLSVLEQAVAAWMAGP